MWVQIDGRSDCVSTLFRHAISMRMAARFAAADGLVMTAEPAVKVSRCRVRCLCRNDCTGNCTTPACQWLRLACHSGAVTVAQLTRLLFERMHEVILHIKEFGQSMSRNMADAIDPLQAAAVTAVHLHQTLRRCQGARSGDDSDVSVQLPGVKPFLRGALREAAAIRQCRHVIHVDETRYDNGAEAKRQAHKRAAPSAIYARMAESCVTAGAGSQPAPRMHEEGQPPRPVNSSVPWSHAHQGAVHKDGDVVQPPPLAAYAVEPGDSPLGYVVPADVLAKRAHLPLKPEPVRLAGRWVELVAYEAAQHADGLHSALSGHAHAGHPAYDAEALVWRFLYGIKTRAEMLAFFAARRDAHDARMFVALAPADSRDPAAPAGTILGTLSLMRNQPEQMSIEVGFIAATPAAQASPMVTEAVYLLGRHVFSVLGYRRLEWKCNARNERSKAAALRLGFTYEGTFRQAGIVQGGYSRDTSWFSILDCEWPERAAALESWLADASPKGAAALAGRRREQLAAMRQAAAAPDAEAHIERDN